MKTLRFFVVFLITLILGLVTLLIMALYHASYDPKNSTVFIESIGDNSAENGMGFVYSKEDDNYYIVTNYHVVDSGKRIYVYNLSNKKEKANLVYYDAYTDIAVLKINNKLNLKDVKFSTNEVKINDEIYYFNIHKNNIESGSILSLNNEITISSDYGNSYYKAVAIKADIENGNSGGPIFNNKEELIGMVSLNDEKNGEAYYIDYKLIHEIVTKLKNHTLIRPNLGGVFASSTNVEALNESGVAVPNVIGVVVLGVMDDSILSDNGILKGDIITKINDKAVIDVVDLQKEIYSYNIGDMVTIDYYRDNVLNTIKITLKK